MDKQKIKQFYFYVLLCRDGSFYGGFTTHLKARLDTHNAGIGAKYTRSRLPVKLLYYQVLQTKSEALSAEAKFKHLTRGQKERFLQSRHVRFPKKLAH